MQLKSTSLEDGRPVPAEFAFARQTSGKQHFELSDNRSPHLEWIEAPDETRSFVLTCVDPDVPSKPDDVNKEGRTVPADLPRVDFVHWLMIDIPAEYRELAAGSCSDGITPHGKRDPFGPPGSRQGQNSYTGWFAGDEDMQGEYFGYDGPCPPWNDSLLHHYRFRVYALDVAKLEVPDDFELEAVRKALEAHVLAQADLTATYTLNPEVSV